MQSPHPPGATEWVFDAFFDKNEAVMIQVLSNKWAVLDGWSCLNLLPSNLSEKNEEDHPVLTPDLLESYHCATNTSSRWQESYGGATEAAASKFLHDQGSNLLWGQSTQGLRGCSNSTMPGWVQPTLGRRYSGRSTGREAGWGNHRDLSGFTLLPASLLVSSGPIVLTQYITATRRQRGAQIKAGCSEMWHNKDTSFL